IYLSDKTAFYSECEKYGLNYPSTEVVRKTTYKQYKPKIKFPLVVKPAESADYFSLTFEGKEKAYIVQEMEELSKILELIYSTDYPHNFLVQEYVPGDVSDEYVMNVYSDHQGKVRMMSLGRIVADDPDPELRGNYVGIINPPKSEKVNRLYADVKSFLEKIQFTGLSNFDFKFDVEKNEFKVFEMNLRQGRSSYFSIMAGSNYAKAIIEDIF